MSFTSSMTVPLNPELIFPALHLSDAATMLTAPRRRLVAFHGEIISLALVLRAPSPSPGDPLCISGPPDKPSSTKRSTCALAPCLPGLPAADPVSNPMFVSADTWPQVGPSLRASVSAQAMASEDEQRKDCSLSTWSEFGSGVANEDPDGQVEPPRPEFQECGPMQVRCGYRGVNRQEDDVSPTMVGDSAVFPLSVTLDSLPYPTTRVQVTVHVWEDKHGAGEEHGTDYINLLQSKKPSQLFKDDPPPLHTQASTSLVLRPPPTLWCRHVNVSGRHIVVLKVQNRVAGSSVSLLDLTVLPNLNTGYLPLMPDGSMMLADTTCHECGEITMASLVRLESRAASLPTRLRGLEEHTVMFQLRLGEPEQQQKQQQQQQQQQRVQEGLDVPMLAVLQWTSPDFLQKHHVFTHYRLPSIRLERPQFVMLADCPPSVPLSRTFHARFTLLNQLHDFLSVRLVWAPTTHTQPEGKVEAQMGGSAVMPIICHTPTNHLGCFRKGSALSFTVGFQALRTGLFEVSAFRSPSPNPSKALLVSHPHIFPWFCFFSLQSFNSLKLSQQMRLKLQFTAAPGPMVPTARKASPSSPMVRELHSGLGRSQSFSHQQLPRNGQFTRTGSAMERRAITPPVSSPRPMPAAPERHALCLDKIAKRSCKVLAIDST
uniref:trafficking protein particle complex subunit 14 isoform X2 n=1 Tax=Myxine glutinosa TaxID=7769 RepID=UPI00358E7C9F